MPKLSCTYTQLKEEVYRVSDIRTTMIKNKEANPESKEMQYLDLLLQKARFALGDMDYQKMEDSYAALSNVTYE